MLVNEAVIIASGGRCHIVNEKGKYIGFDRERKIAFLDDSQRAFVYDFVKDDVPSQLAKVEEMFPQAKWRAVPFSDNSQRR